MDDSKKDQEATAPASPHDRTETPEAPERINVDASVSTDDEGKRIDLPDLGGKID